MDIVYIRELEVRTIIGIFDWEREQRQVVRLAVVEDLLEGWQHGSLLRLRVDHRGVERAASEVRQ